MGNMFLSEPKEKRLVADSVIMPNNIKQGLSIFGMYKTKDTKNNYDCKNKNRNLT